MPDLGESAGDCDIGNAGGGSVGLAGAWLPLPQWTPAPPVVHPPPGCLEEDMNQQGYGSAVDNNVENLTGSTVSAMENEHKLLLCCRHVDLEVIKTNIVVPQLSSYITGRCIAGYGQIKFAVLWLEMLGQTLVSASVLKLTYKIKSTNEPTFKMNVK